MMHHKQEINTEKVISTIVGLAVFGTVLLANISVFSRLVKISLPATEELLRYVFVWIIMLCTALVYNDNGLISITILEELIEKRGNKLAVKILWIFSNACVLIFAGICVYFSLQIAWFQISSGKLTPVMEIPMFLVTMGMSIGSLLWLMFAGVKVIKVFKN